MLGLPKFTAGMRIGLLGGSFDPPHKGHVHITKQAMRRFGLDRIWWLVTPGNPLKQDSPASLERRMDACRAIMQHPRVDITDVETRLHTRYTADTLQKLTTICPGVQFVWLMGADNLAGFHKWQQWDWIVQNIPIGVTSRPGEHLRAGHSVMAQKYYRYRLPFFASRLLPSQPSPVWCLLEGPVVDISSTDIRESGKWIR